MQWLAHDREARLDYYHRRLSELIADFQHRSAHPRTAPAIAAKMAALELFLEFACEARALNDEQATDWQEKFKKALLKTSDAQVPDASLTEVAARFVHPLP